MNRLPYVRRNYSLFIFIINGVPCLKVGIVKCLRLMNLKQLVQA